MEKAQFFKRIFFALFLVSSLQAASSFNGTFYSQLSAHFGKSIWTDGSYGQLGLYSVPDLSISSYGLVIQEEAFFLDDNQLANSVGLGLRVIDPKGVIWGINSFYDYFKGYYGGLKQLGAGFEILTPTATLHFNGYLPFSVSGKKGPTKTITSFSKPYLELITPVQFLYQGFEFTADKGFAISELYFQFSLGTYYIDDYYQSRSFGLQVRADIWWHPFVYMGVFYTNDAIFKQCLQGYIGVSIPFSSIVRNQLPSFEPSCLSYLNGKDGKSARISRWGLGCPGCGSYYKINWIPQCTK